MPDEPLDYEVSSGNVFADAGLLNPEEVLARAELLRRLNNAIRARRLTPARAAAVLGTRRSTVENVLNGKLSSFSLVQLTAFLTALGEEVEIYPGGGLPESPRAERTVAGGD
jgi:predicted XRE-type DNA-binding protein